MHNARDAILVLGTLRDAEECVESTNNQRIVHRRGRRWKDPEWMHMIEMDSVVLGIFRFFVVRLLYALLDACELEMSFFFVFEKMFFF